MTRNIGTPPVELNPFSHPDQAVTLTGGLSHGHPVVMDPQVQRTPGVIDNHLDRRDPRRMLPCVGQRLLDDPIGRKVNPRREIPWRATHLEGDRKTIGPGIVHELFDRRQPRLRDAQGGLVLVPEHRDEPPHFSQRVGPGAANRLQRAADIIFVIGDKLGRTGLDHDYAHCVGHHVV
ncbi:hypothetical protein M3B51_14880 [Kocuria carniphila]|nr:hypothetical protein [Kocuria carniphila]MCT1804058.1 hypothetical protein [Kocuria carniphila]